MHRVFFLFVLLTVAGPFLAGPVRALEPIPQESGVSGFINLGVGGVTAKSNMIAGNRLVDIGSRRIDSLRDSPGSESDVIPVINGELAYTFGSTRTQLFVGNSFEDFVRFETATLAGLRQELPDMSRVQVAYVFSGIPTEVWKDPYVIGQKREKTDRESAGLRLVYDRILGSDFEFQFTWRRIELDDELSGLTQLGLPPESAGLLNREGDSYQFEVVYPFRLAGGRHTLAPAFTYSRFDLDGDAMAKDSYQGKLTYFYKGEVFLVAANLVLGLDDYDEANPIFFKKREDDVVGGNVSIFYRNLFDIDRLSLVATVAGFRSDANIDFYDTTIGFYSLSALYRF